MRRVPGLGVTSQRIVTVLIASALVLAACDPGVSVTARNKSGQDFYVRINWDSGSVGVWRLPAHTTGGVYDNFGATDFGGSVQLLGTDCSVVGSWDGHKGGTVVVQANGAATFGPDNEREVVGDNLSFSDNCGSHN